jgi:hypothetical protein
MINIHITITYMYIYLFPLSLNFCTTLVTKFAIVTLVDDPITLVRGLSKNHVIFHRGDRRGHRV